MVGIVKPVDMDKLTVSKFKHDPVMWWHQFTCRGADYQLGTLGWSDFKSELVDAFVSIDRELKLHHQLAPLKQQTSIAVYIKQFRQIVPELGDQAPDVAALLFIFMEGVKADVQIQMILARQQLLVEAEQVVERTDIAHFSSGKCQVQQGEWQRPHQWQLRNPQLQQYQYQKPPPPAPWQGPMPMDLGALQDQQQHQQKPPQYGASRQIICYRCSKQGYIVKDCRVRIRGQPTQQQPDFTWIQQPFQYQQPPMYQKPQSQQFQPTFAQMYAQPLQYSQPQFQQPLLNYIHMGAYSQPQIPPQQDSQPPPPPPLNDNRDRY